MLPNLISLVIAFSNPIPLSETGSAPVELASHSMSLDDRYPVKSVSDIFKDNILLTMSYMDGKVTTKNDINWDNIREPFDYKFSLNPGEEFAFHNVTLPSYSKNVVKNYLNY